MAMGGDLDRYPSDCATEQACQRFEKQLTTVNRLVHGQGFLAATASFSPNTLIIIEYKHSPVSTRGKGAPASLAITYKICAPELKARR
jgi:hypothetical protein